MRRIARGTLRTVRGVERDQQRVLRERPVLRTRDLEYDLPADRIAVHPAEPRDSARLMVVRRDEPGREEDLLVRDLPGVLRAGDLLVLNTTRVLPARFRGERVGTGGRIEGLYLSDAGLEPLQWHALIRGRHTRAGVELSLDDGTGRESGVRLRVLHRSPEEAGAWVVEVVGAEGLSAAILERVGLTPLPPYILAARKQAGVVEAEGADREQYQTVYARPDQAASVAAPTAGLHFTPELMARLAAAGVERSEVVLHVGSGTFKPVETEHVEEHPMHAEWCSMSGEAAQAVRRTREAGGRVIPVGTTAARTLEAYAAEAGLEARPPLGIQTRLLITPGYRFRWVDGLLTNFHLPRSTLMALVAAALGEGGVERLKGLYARAAERGYRFYSYGDAMLVL